MENNKSAGGNAVLKTGTEMTLGTMSTIPRLSEGGNCIYTAGSPEAKQIKRHKRSSLANNN